LSWQRDRSEESGHGSDATATQEAAEFNIIRDAFGPIFDAPSTGVQDAQWYEAKEDYFNENQIHVGYLYNPKEVRNVLNNSGMFVGHQVRSWNRYIVVPAGTDHLNYIEVYAAKQGLSVRGLYSRGKLVKAPQEMSR
jgi:hypothetical protein